MAVGASIGAGLTAAAMAAAGAYFLYGSKQAANNRKKVKGWVEEAKKEVMKGLEKAKSMSKEEYEEMVEKVSDAQTALAKISKTELAEFKKEMKGGWKVIAKKAAAAAVSAGVAEAPKKKAAPAKAPAKAVVKKAPAKAAAPKKAAPAAKKAPAKKK